MLENIRGLSSWHCKDYKTIYTFRRKRIVKQDESYGDLEFIAIIGFGGKLSRYWMRNKKQSWKWIITKTPYLNLILDRRVMNIEERLARHMSFPPQEVVRCEIWTGDL
jgi:hypothetical protein